MARRIYKHWMMHDGGTGVSSGPGLEVIEDGSREMGGNGTVGWSQQSLGAGHLSLRNGGDYGPLINWESVPPRAYSSAQSGHGGKMAMPEWPIGRVWDGMNALGGYRRLRYRFRCAVGVTSGDLLTWGPVSIGMRMDPNNLSISTSIWGVEYFIGQRTGDGSQFPNPGLEDGWGIRWRYAPLGSIGNSNELMGTGQGMHYIEFVYVDSDAPVLRCRFDNVVRQFDGADFDEATTVANNVFGPAVDGSVATAHATVEIHELNDTEDPFDADEVLPQFIVTSDEDAVMDTNEEPLMTSGENT